MKEGRIQASPTVQLPGGPGTLLHLPLAPQPFLIACPGWISGLSGRENRILLGGYFCHLVLSKPLGATLMMKVIQTFLVLFPAGEKFAKKLERDNSSQTGGLSCSPDPSPQGLHPPGGPAQRGHTEQRRTWPTR